MRNSGKKNLTQIEVLENVILQLNLSIESLGVREVPIQTDLRDSVYVLYDWNRLEYLDDHDHYRLRYESSQSNFWSQ